MSTQSSSAICRLLTIVDGATEEIVDLIELIDFDLQSFALQFDVPLESDPEMLDRYAVGPDDIDFLSRCLGRRLEWDFRTYAYFIDAAERDT
jgi:hypothetical protein